MEKPNSILQQLRTIQWKAIPKGLIAFFVFSIVIMIANLIVNQEEYETLRGSIVPITGWASGSMYSFTAIMTFFMFVKPTTVGRNLLVFVLIVIIVEGFFGIVLGVFGEDYGNPYLMTSKWRPICSIVIPGVWILVLLSPSMKYFCLNRK